MDGTTLELSLKGRDGRAAKREGLTVEGAIRAGARFAEKLGRAGLPVSAESAGASCGAAFL